MTTTHQPATDLGFLLHKHPDRAQQASLSFGTAHLFYPEADDQRCTFALLLEVDPVALVRGAAPAAGPLDQYVNDRPYVGSSFLSVALSPDLGHGSRRALPSPARPRGGRPAARGADRPAVLPRRRRHRPPAVRAARLRSRGRAAAPGPGPPRVGTRLPLRRDPQGGLPAGGPAHPPDGPDPGARRRASTTMSATTRSRSCCAGARAGWPATRSGT